MAGRIPLIVGFSLVVFSVSLVVYWILTGSLFGLGASKPETTIVQPVANSQPATTQPVTSQPATLQPSSASQTPVAVASQPVQQFESKKTPPSPPPPDVLWSKLNEQIKLLEDTRHTLIKSIIERLPEAMKMTPLPVAATTPDATDFATLTTPNATANRTEKTEQQQTITWQAVTQEMLALEQTRQQLIQALAKQLEDAEPSRVAIQPLQFEQSRLPAPVAPSIESSVLSDSMSQNTNGLTLLTAPANADTELLAEYQLRPADTNNLLNSRVTSMGYVFILSDLVFETDKAELHEGNLYMLERLAQIMLAHPEQTILIEGHTDDRGSSHYNLQLSQRRAQAVYQALQARGVAETRFKVRGYGELLPIADNESEAGRLKNRRVEITLLSEMRQPLPE